MKCREAEKLVQSYIDNTLSPKELEAFISHVSQCTECYEELEIYFIIQHAIRFLEDEEHGNFNMKALLAEDLKKKQRQIKRKKRMKKTLFYLIAAFVITLLVLLMIR